MSKICEEAIIKLVELNVGAGDDITGCAIKCNGVDCVNCPVNYTDGSITLGEIRKMAPEFHHAGYVFTGDNVKYIGPAGPLSGLYGKVLSVNADGFQVEVEFGKTSAHTVWLNTAMVALFRGELPEVPKVSGESIPTRGEVSLAFDNAHRQEASGEAIGSQSEDPQVRQPSHYQVFDGLESIEVIARTMTTSEFRGFCMGNVLKYRLRAGKKSDQANVSKDLAKAEFYKELFDKHKGLCYAAI